MTREPMNFSVYPAGMKRFSDDWEAIAGIEPLLGYAPPPTIPTGLDQAVHLPYWVAWLDVWRDEPTAVAHDDPTLDPQELCHDCGSRNSAEMIATQRRLWLKRPPLTLPMPGCTSVIM